uniref:NADH-quinone oxidoreductase subunit C n=1 Tax=Candidatus Kentrum sp. FM TaxID=2126340 RepID=A0A450W9T9_9GAMM|nr:MAG: NADH-quinone oxidoreductase subunit C [Candidatus Kentron sp. FM]VFJ71279.1 MAG: NADH-quinone oxidoreductase subunit C [Candidatus Kentron sp. FM]VFK13824.1 MAG: NADH-quinone oxidoreductase subunit C [Candidatus Kentron sp. FM]
MHELHEKLTRLFPVGDFTEQRPDLAFLTVPREHLRSVLVHLRDREGFGHLVLLTAVDWLEDGVFQLTYLLCGRGNHRDVGLKVILPREGAAMDSIHDLWPTAATYQRELREMFGIDFPGSPGVNDEFVLEGWRDIPPYRRDFDTKKFAEENFGQRPGRETRDPARYMKEKRYPDEN